MGVVSHSHSSLTMTSSVLAAIVRNCPNIQCCHFGRCGRDTLPGDGAPCRLPTVDVIADHNSLRKLLCWLNQSPEREFRDFRIDTQLFGAKTLVLCRWESPVNEVYTSRSFGDAFESAIMMTHAAPDCPSVINGRSPVYVCYYFPVLRIWAR